MLLLQHNLYIQLSLLKCLGSVPVLPQLVLRNLSQDPWPSPHWRRARFLILTSGLWIPAEIHRPMVSSLFFFNTEIAFCAGEKA